MPFCTEFEVESTIFQYNSIFIKYKEMVILLNEI